MYILKTFSRDEGRFVFFNGDFERRRKRIFITYDSWIVGKENAKQLSYVDALDIKNELKYTYRITNQNTYNIHFFPLS